MKAIITILAENTVRRPGLIAEHGLSFLIQTDRGAALFDTGQGHAAVFNAVKMEVDLRSVESIVLSHGHFDHTGGLRRTVEALGALEERRTTAASVSKGIP